MPRTTEKLNTQIARMLYGQTYKCILDEQKVIANEDQKNRLLDLFDIFENSQLYHGDYVIKIENDKPKLLVSFEIS